MPRITPASLFAVAAALFLAAVFWPGAGGGRVAEARALVGHEPVILFSAPWCGYCDRLRADFQRHGVRFAERDVEASTAAQQAWRLLGGRGVPLTLAGDEVIAGYDRSLPQRLAAAPR